MTTVYTTFGKVASRLGLDDFNAGTGVSGKKTPLNTEEVERFINEAEDFIDREARHAWREVSVVDEYYNVRILNFDRTTLLRELPIYLKHREIKTFDTEEGDKLEYYNGSNYIDLVATGTEGREADFYVDYNMGIIYFRRTKPRFKNRGVRVTYRYGEDTVPSDIQEATTLLACLSVIDSDMWSLVLPEGTSGSPKSELIEKWNERVDRILANRKELRYASW